MHTFEQSGLGKAPFSVVRPTKTNVLELGQVFYCEHCGTQIKHRHYVKSADGKVSIVGIDCLKKTGDEGLFAGVKRLRAENRAAVRSMNEEAKRLCRLAQERQANNGLTNAELIERLLKQVDESAGAFCGLMDDHPVVANLTRLGFERAMQIQAYSGTPYTAGQLTVIAEILAKKASGARKGSKAYAAALVQAKADAEALQALLVAQADKIGQLKQQMMALRCNRRAG